MKDVTVLLPTFEEEEAVGQVIDEVREVLPDCRILVAYTPGKDRTLETLKAKKVEWIADPRRGKGNNVRNALRFIKSPYIVMLDSDYTYPARYIPELLEGMEDVALGYRHTREPAAMSALNFFGNKVLSLVASILFRRRVYDVCTGMWAFRKEVLDEFVLESTGFTLEADLFVNCVRHKCKLRQIPIEYRCRVDGALPKLRVVDGVNIMAFLLKKRLNPLEQIAFNLCPGERCEHYREAIKRRRKCYYEPQCWRGRVSRWVKRLRARRYDRYAQD